MKIPAYIWIGAGALILLGFTMRKAQARGIRNNNPCNVKAIDENGRKIAWKGLVGIDEFGHAIFDTEENGLRAASRVLLNYGKNRGISSLLGIAKRWQEKDAENYARALSQYSGISVFAYVNLGDYETRAKIVKAMIVAENGISYIDKYDFAAISAASKLA